MSPEEDFSVLVSFLLNRSQRNSTEVTNVKPVEMAAEWDSSTTQCGYLPVGPVHKNSGKKNGSCVRQVHCGLWHHVAPRILNLRMLCSNEMKNAASLSSEPAQGI